MLDLYSKYKTRSSIKGLTIRMSNPQFGRKPFDQKNKYNDLINGEYILRKKAYKDSKISIDESFFDDSDMQSDYYLIIIYSDRMSVPLLTARYYFDKNIIYKSLKGDYDNAQQKYFFSDFIFEELNKENVFLIDRLSANKSAEMYRLYRDYIFMKFYLQLISHNRGKSLLAMARRDKYEKLLTKYIRLGLIIIGIIHHKGKEHWVLFGNLKTNVFNLRKASLLNILFLFKLLFYKNKHGKY
jgi:hypothetical protein